MALTAFEDAKTKKKCEEVGIKEVLNKPITDQKLLRIILIYHFKLSES